MSVFYEKKDVKLCCHKDKNLVERVHCHNELEIILCQSGSFDAYVNSRRYTVSSGELLVVFPNQIHSYINISPGDYYPIIFSADYVPDLKSLLINNTPRDNKINFKEYPEIDDTVNRLISDYNNKKRFASSVLIGYVNLLMAKILPHIELNSSVATNENLLFNVLDYCSNNFSHKIALEDIAKALYVSPSKISALLNHQLNISLPQLLNFLRISKACSLLKETNMVITDIASAVGFGSIRSFNRAFLEIVGKTPTTLRIESVKEKKINKNHTE